MTDWVVEQVGSGGTVGIDGLVYAASDAKSLKSVLDARGIRLETTLDPFAAIWKDRPEIAANKIFLLSDEITGESTKSKIERILGELDRLDADGLIVVSLDALAWIFNMRGSDVDYNPVAVAYGYVSKKESVLFVDEAKLDHFTKSALLKQGVKIDDYGQVFNYVANLPEKSTICITGSKINYKLYQTIPASYPDR